MAHAPPNDDSHFNIEKFQSINGDDLLNYYLPNTRCIAKCIAKCELQDGITDALNRHEDEDLAALRQSLLVEIPKTFTQYTERTPIKRKAKHRIVGDIVTLTACLANNDTTYLDEVYQKLSTP